MTREILLGNGEICLVDDDDYESVSRFHWSAMKGFSTTYAFRKERVSGIIRTVYLHRALMNPDARQKVDHINGNGLDNRRANLRCCTNQQNVINRRKKQKARSRFKGVTWHEKGQKWRARIMIDRQEISLGLFATEADAAVAYNAAAKAAWGEYACLNELELAV